MELVGATLNPQRRRALDRGGGGPATCKHLLAAVIMPHMFPWSMPGGGGVDDVEVANNGKFARLVARASIG